MMHMQILFLLFISSILFTNMNHPLSLGFMLLIQTILIAMLSGLISKSFWFSYILFLIFLGGMLVLFIYVTAIASNEMFNLSIKTLLMTILSITILSIIIMFLNKYINFYLFSNNESTPYMELSYLSKENSYMLTKLYNYPTNYMTIFLMNYLLITLIAVVKITNMFFGPIRFMK